MKKTYLSIIAFILFVCTVNAQIAYVTVSGSGLQNGTSWSNAYNGTQLQAAINQSGINQV